MIGTCAVACLAADAGRRFLGCEKLLVLACEERLFVTIMTADAGFPADIIGAESPDRLEKQHGSSHADSHHDSVFAFQGTASFHRGCAQK